MKRISYVITVISCLVGVVGNANALTVSRCAMLFHDQHCATFDVADANNCTCDACQTDYLPRSGHITRESITLTNLCGCVSDGSCAMNPDTDYQAGTYTCVDGRADWSTCLPSFPGGGDASCAEKYSKCSDAASGGCRAFSVTIDGVLYCSTGGSCGLPPNALATTQVSRYCSDYKGVSECASFCAVQACTSPNYAPAPDRRSCVCNTGYYRDTSGDCVRCPDGGTTADIGSSSITACYIPANQSISDSPGTYVYTQNCFYK